MELILVSIGIFVWIRIAIGIYWNWYIDMVYSHFTFWASPQQILLHFPINLLHFPIKFASFPQKNASFPYAMLCHFANILKPNFTKYSHFFYIFGIKFCL